MRKAVKAGIFPVGPAGQRGASLFSTLLVLALLAIVLSTAFKLVPVYLDNRLVVEATEAVLERNEDENLSLSELRNQVRKALSINGIRDFDASNIRLVTVDGVEYIDINYESRVALFYNIDALMTFANRLEK